MNEDNRKRRYTVEYNTWCSTERASHTWEEEGHPEFIIGRLRERGLKVRKHRIIGPDTDVHIMPGALLSVTVEEVEA